MPRHDIYSEISLSAVAISLSQNTYTEAAYSFLPINPVEDKEITVEDGTALQVPAEEDDVRAINSEQVDMEISHILEKIDNFTQVSMLLESGKSMLKELSNDLEERMILMHKEQIEKWQEEIKELRLLDTANEEIDSLLYNIKYLLQNVHVGR